MRLEQQELEEFDERLARELAGTDFQWAEVQRA